MSLETLFSKEIDRRDFLKRAKTLLFSYGGLRIIDFMGNSLEGKLFSLVENVEAKEQSHNLEPNVPGCYIGFYHSGIWNKYYSYLVRKIRKKPKIIIPSMGFLQQQTSFPKGAVGYLTSLGAIPFMYRPLNRDAGIYGLENLVKNKKFGDHLTEYADGLVKCGKPILLCTMRELNTDGYIWGQQPEVAKELWGFMWQIFQDKSANRFTKWVWEVYCPEAAEKKADDPEIYYPGDEQVDWINLKVYSTSRKPKDNQMFGPLVRPTYEKMQTNHPNKPIMVTFGRTNLEKQAEWIEDAHQTIKTWDQIKAAIYWNDTNFTLDKKSLRIMREVFKDKYFIGAK